MWSLLRQKQVTWTSPATEQFTRLINKLSKVWRKNENKIENLKHLAQLDFKLFYMRQIFERKKNITVNNEFLDTHSVWQVTWLNFHLSKPIVMSMCVLFFLDLLSFCHHLCAWPRRKWKFQ